VARRTGLQSCHQLLVLLLLLLALVQVINKMYKDLNVDAKQLRSDGFTDVHTWRFVPAGLDVASGDAAEAFQQACLYACTDV